MTSQAPDFFIIGAPKCGTTTLYHWLRDHPDVFMPDAKEPHFFTPHLSDRYCRVRDDKAYQALFAAAKPGQITGEASVLYCFFPQAIKNILRHNPQAKFIYMLRHPVDMVISYHGQLLLNLEENIDDFEHAWKLQEERSRGNAIPKTSTDPALLQYKMAASLGDQLENFYNLVPQNQRMTIFLEDMAVNPEREYKHVLDFLNLGNDGRDHFYKSNEAAVIKSRFVQKFLQNPPRFLSLLSRLLKKSGFPLADILRRLNKRPGTKPPPDHAFRLGLVQEFETQIAKVERLTGLTLKHWRS